MTVDHLIDRFNRHISEKQDKRLDKSVFWRLRQIATGKIRDGHDVDSIMADFDTASLAVLDFFSSTNLPKLDVKPENWWHHNPIPKNKNKVVGQPYIDKFGVQSSITLYLEQSLRSDEIDRQFFDALMASEIYDYLDYDRTRFAISIPNPWIPFLFFISIGIARYAIDISIYGYIVIVGLFAFPYLYKYFGVGPMKIRKLVKAMDTTYAQLSGPVGSIIQLRLHMERARDLGVVWPAALWVMLEDMEARKSVI